MTPDPKRRWPQMLPGIWPVRPRVGTFADETPSDDMHPDFRAAHRFFMILNWVYVASVVGLAGMFYAVYWFADLVRAWRGH